MTNLSLSQRRNPFWVLEWKQVAIAFALVCTIVAATLVIEHSFFLPQKSLSILNQGELAYTREDKPAILEITKIPKEEEREKEGKILIIVHKTNNGEKGEIESVFMRNYLLEEEDETKSKFNISPDRI